MLLGRLRGHLADQNWLAVTVDMTVVLVSILLAFQIDRWAEYRRDQHLELEYLLRLKVDLQMEIGQLILPWVMSMIVCRPSDY